MRLLLLEICVSEHPWILYRTTLFKLRIRYVVQLLREKLLGADHSQRGPLCHFSPSTKLDPSHSEDCLFLDVLAPTQNETAILHPVFVYFQGGGFNTLSNPNLNGTSLINAGENDLVIVTFNYRVGVWGFLTSQEVQADGDLNVGLLDQRKCLEWIHQYIHLVGALLSLMTVTDKL